MKHSGVSCVASCDCGSFAVSKEQLSDKTAATNEWRNNFLEVSHQGTTQLCSLISGVENRYRKIDIEIDNMKLNENISQRDECT